MRKGEILFTERTKLVRKILQSPNSWSKSVSLACISRPLHALVFANSSALVRVLRHVRCSHRSSMGAGCSGDLGSWRTQMPSSRMNLCSSVMGCQLIFPSLLLGFADRPACGVWCGVSCRCAARSSLKSLSFDFWGWGAFSWQDASAVFD